jgi:hypothetical protein
MENTRKQGAFLVPFLLVAVLGLTGQSIYQNHVIQRQRFELRWLLEHATIDPASIAKDLAAGAAKDGGKPLRPGASAAQAAPSAPAASNAKP